MCCSMTRPGIHSLSTSKMQCSPMKRTPQTSGLIHRASHHSNRKEAVLLRTMGNRTIKSLVSIRIASTTISLPACPPARATWISSTASSESRVCSTARVGLVPGRSGNPAIQVQGRPAPRLGLASIPTATRSQPWWSGWRTGRLRRLLRGRSL